MFCDGYLRRQEGQADNQRRRVYNLPCLFGILPDGGDKLMQYCECGKQAFVEVKRDTKTTWPCQDCYDVMIKKENERNKKGKTYEQDRI